MRVATFLFLMTCLGLAVCRSQTFSGESPQPAAASNQKTVPKKLGVKHLPNAHRVHEKVISGGLPEGDAAFRELANLGVTTIISVDGMKPDVALAKKHGMRYVHLPHSYDGISTPRAKELAKAVRDLPGPIYIHCHHGMHRAPAAAAVACVSAGLIDPALAETILKSAGTSPNYRGLYDVAKRARRMDPSALDALPAEFPEVAAVPPLAEAMVALEHTFAHLNQMAAKDWQRLPAHPDLEPAHEALLLREHFTELSRLEDVAQRPDEFRRSLRDSESAAQKLEQALRSTPRTFKSAAASLEVVGKNCTACHQKFRDTPLHDQ